MSIRPMSARVKIGKSPRRCLPLCPRNSVSRTSARALATSYALYEGSLGGTSRVRVRLPNGLLLIAGSFVQFDVGSPRIVNKCERNERGLRVRPIELDSVRLQIIQE